MKLCEQCGNDIHCAAELAEAYRMRNEFVVVAENNKIIAAASQKQLTEAVQILRDFGGMGRGEWIAARTRFLANTVKL